MEVAASQVRGLIAMASAAGLAIDPLVGDMPFDRDSIVQLRHVRWDHYCIFLERIEHVCGGPDALDAIVTEHHLEMLSPEIRHVLGSMISPNALLNFMIGTLCPHTFPAVDFDHEHRGERRFLVTARLRPSARPSATWFRVSLPFMQQSTTLLGLPASEVEVVELTERSLVFAMRVPPSRTLAARLARGTRDTLGASVRVLRQFGAEARDRSDAHAATRAQIGELGRELARHAEPGSLGDAIVAEVAKLGWQRVALFVVPSGASEPVLLRSRGGAGAYEHQLELEVAGFRVGRLQTAGRGDASLLAELAPWLAICLDNARVRRADDPARIASRLGEIQHRSALSPRQAEILALVVRGRSNKEIAAELACADNTVEYHLTQVLRKTRTTGRTHLVAWFWSSKT
jgi:DNA-binding CsgD family transcriptional regulator